MTSTPQSGDWFKSSYSNNSGGECIEGARLGTVAMAIRDSKDTSRGNLTIGTTSWNALTTALKRER
ncbi:DUF397 domain-containing protein [Yinghuangia sp. ASG 101]|uniref:DUF397 domain-containing protein n=1 Tax=Yinghuangia sp. ASG 101 TaxID=2896848 RepID=UPI001E2AF512|nr:DUF397 domain-containing protein [Yinghuangia sp. ASG 101]UGQ09421.1 DUF397 domain-containing protein [Yinghuangia sp. ASG 101]